MHFFCAGRRGSVEADVSNMFNLTSSDDCGTLYPPNPVFMVHAPLVQRFDRVWKSVVRKER